MLRRKARPLVALALAATVALAVAEPRATRAQPRGGAPTLGHLALAWLHGDYRAPIVCEIDEVPRRALRRVRIVPGPSGTHRPSDRIVFHDLEAPAGTRCHDELGNDEPNLIGSVTLVWEGRDDRPDLAEHEFSETLRREGGFSFPIATGALRMGAAGTPVAELSPVDFKGGRARVRAVTRGTDAFRRLADFGPRRKLVLVLEAPDGARLELDLVAFAP